MRWHMNIDGDISAFEDRAAGRLFIGFSDILAGADFVSGIIGGSSDADAAEEAAAIQAQAAAEAAARMEAQGQQGRADLAPWRTAGGAAVNRLNLLLGIGMPGSGKVMTKAQYQAQLESRGNRYTTPEQLAALDRAYATYVRGASKRKSPAYGSLMKDFGLSDFRKEPGYNFRLSEGTKGIDRAAAARGSFDSGATLKALQRYTQDYASNEFGNAYARDAANKGRKFNFLSGVSGSGLQAAGTGAALGADIARSIADLYTQGANARAAGVVGSSQASSGAMQGAFDDLSDYVMMQNLLRG